MPVVKKERTPVGAVIQKKLDENHLTITWLAALIRKKTGYRTDKGTLCRALSGKYCTPGADEILRVAMAILSDYERTFDKKGWGK